MKTRTKTTIATVGAAAALAFPAAASAAPDWQDHLDSADRALDRATSLVDNDQAKAALQMARANALTRKAGRSADDIANARKAANAIRLVAEQFGLNGETIAELVDQLRARFQVGAVDEVETAIDGRAKAVGVLTDLLGEVPAQAVPGIMQAIDAITTGGGETEELAEALDSGQISPEAQAAIEAALAKAAAAIQGALDQLGALVSTLPPEARPHVQAALDHVAGHLGSVLEMLNGFPPVGGPSGSGGPGGGASVPPIQIPIPPIAGGPGS